MIAEDKQDDLSMEDILSSIKDILDNDVQEKDGVVAEEVHEEAVKQTAAPISIPAAEEIEEDEDEVFDLSSDMIIGEEDLAAFSAEADNISLDDLTAAADSLSLDDIVIKEEAEEVINFAPTEAVYEEKSDPVVDEPEVDFVIPEIDDLPSLDDLNSFDFEDDAEPILNIESEIETVVEAEPSIELDEAVVAPIVEPEEEVLAAAVELMEDRSDSPFLNNEEHLESEPIFSVEDEITPESIEPVVEEIEVEPVILTENVEPVTMDSEEIDEILTSASELIEADAEVEEAKSSAVDASADIINNFAKMFATKTEVKEDSVKVPVIAPQVIPIFDTDNTGLGDGSKTIEQVVQDVIRDIIGNAVSAKFVADSSLDTYAREEIKTQTHAWLDKNLTAVVEKAVQREIERVMAKVGK